MKKSGVALGSIQEDTRPDWRDEIPDDNDEITDSVMRFQIKHFTLFTIVADMLFGKHTRGVVQAQSCAN